MNVFLTKAAIKLEFKSHEFTLKTQFQIVKDFNLSGIHFNSQFSSKELEYDQIILEIESNLVKVIKFGETQLLQLLYQIDIPQSRFLSLLGNPKMLGELSELILKREAYKIYLRRRF
ncbi:MAG: hypothetical protein QNK85_03345 [Crocinitomicaceae bacterium]|jgi:hypothetical protein